MADSDRGFFADFLDDYYAECDEHLGIVRRDLLALEPYVDQRDVDRELVDELFRSFHTLKGLSAMVGVTEAERLAHDMESYLRALRKNEVIFSPEGMDTLIAATRTLENVIDAHRKGTPAPDIEKVVERLTLLLSPALQKETDQREQTPAIRIPVKDLNEQEQRLLESALESGARAWRFEFTPDRDLAERGINVSKVRADLKQIGDIIRAKPQTMEDERIKFEFIVATREDEGALSRLEQEGLSYGLIEVRMADREEVVDKVEHTSHAALFPANIVRVDLGRLDDLMRIVGELIVSRARLEAYLKEMETVVPSSQWRALQDTSSTMERQLRELREGITRVRMVPIREVFERMRFAARQLAGEHHKKVSVELYGEDTEMDKYVVERIMDPLLHMVRNAISHGIEPAAERAALGKPLVGKLILRASAAGDIVNVEVEDDGRGIDIERVARRAEESGLTASGGGLETSEVLRLISESGFSTIAEADMTSGRGIGMAVVRNTVQELGGTVSLVTEPHVGTSFTIRLPLTLAIAEALIVSAGGQSFAVPVPSILEIVEVDPGSITVLENNEILPYRTGVLPFIRLAKLFGIDETVGRSLYALVVAGGSSPIGLGVDRLLGQREVVVRGLDDPLLKSPYISGATELGNGRVVLILDVRALIQIATERRRRASLKPHR